MHYRPFFTRCIMAGFFLMIAVFPVAALDIDTDSPFLDSYAGKLISMDFENAKLVDVLKIFSEQSDKNLVTASAVGNKTVTVYLDKVPVEEALEQILRANNLTYEILPGSDIYIVKELKTIEDQIITRVYQLKHASVSKAQINSLISISSEGGGSPTREGGGLVDAIKGVLTKDGSLTEDTRTNSLIISDIEENFPRIEQTIVRLDVPIPMILIEVEMLEVDKSLTDQIGVRWGSTPLVLTGGEKQTTFPWDGTVPGFNKLQNVEYEGNHYTAGTLNAAGLTATVQFLRTDVHTKNLARPRIMTLNNETAQIKISTDEAIATQTVSSGEGASAQITEEVERYETGVILTVTPQANLETGEITVALVPKFIVVSASTALGASVLNPEERGAQSIFRVQSGNTIVIGGLMREDVTETFNKVPILGDLPILGRLFRHKSDSRTERELLIFITPHILPEGSAMPAKANIKNIVREQDIPYKD